MGIHYSGVMLAGVVVPALRASAAAAPTLRAAVDCLLSAAPANPTRRRRDCGGHTEHQQRPLLQTTPPQLLPPLPVSCASYYSVLS